MVGICIRESWAHSWPHIIQCCCAAAYANEEDYTEDDCTYEDYEDEEEEDEEPTLTCTVFCSKACDKVGIGKIPFFNSICEKPCAKICKVSEGKPPDVTLTVLGIAGAAGITVAIAKPCRKSEVWCQLERDQMWIGTVDEHCTSRFVFEYLSPDRSDV